MGLRKGNDNEEQKRWQHADPGVGGGVVLGGELYGGARGIAGELGDLFASLVKRHCGIKDYGNIFPGHGGMMDRLDSVLFVSVLIYLYQSLMW